MKPTKKQILNQVGQGAFYESFDRVELNIRGHVERKVSGGMGIQVWSQMTSRVIRNLSHETFYRFN